jgi:hypothetical protein
VRVGVVSLPVALQCRRGVVDDLLRTAHDVVRMVLLQNVLDTRHGAQQMKVLRQVLSKSFSQLYALEVGVRKPVGPSWGGQVSGRIKVAM